MWGKDDKEIKELLEQYMEIEIRDSEIQEKRKENQAEPSEEFRKTMEQLIADVPKYVKKQWWQKQKDFFAFACTMCTKVAVLAVLFVVFASELCGKGMLTASVNQIVLNQRKESTDLMDFLVSQLKDSSTLKPISELVVEFRYVPAGYEFVSDELLPEPETKMFCYAKDTESKFTICVSKVETAKKSAFLSNIQEYSVFQAGVAEVTKIGENIYAWVQFDYLFVLNSTEDLQEELEQLIASIQIS